MRLRCVSLALSSALLLAACQAAPERAAAPTALQAAPDPTATVVVAGQQATGGLPGHDGARAMAQVQALAETIGPRVAGTASARQAVDYLRGELQSYGYDVEVMPFTFRDEQARAASVALASETLEGVALAGSTRQTVSGPAVYIGLADSAGIGGRDLSGMIAVADRGVLRFGEKLANAGAAGAAALVIVNSEPGRFLGDLGTSASIPVVGARGQDADRLKAAAKTGETVTVSATGAAPRDAANVVARPAATAPCRLLVGAHFDSVPNAPGASDNASGSANVVELARAFASDGPDKGLCFALFGAEEQGLFGSAALAARMQREGALPEMMLNLDVTGIGSDVRVIGPRDQQLRGLAVAQRMGIPAQVDTLPLNSGSDHQSFDRAGVPVLFYTSGEFQTIHTRRDVVSDIDAAELDRVGDLAYATITAFLDGTFGN